MSNKIKKDDPRLTAFVLGELDQADAGQIQTAVSNSPELAGAVDEIRMAVELLGTAYQSESPLALLDQQKSELARVVSGEAGDATTTIGRKPDGLDRQDAYPTGAATRKSRAWLPIAIAASLIGLLVGGTFHFYDDFFARGLASMDSGEAAYEMEEDWEVEADRFSKDAQPQLESSKDKAVIGSGPLANEGGQEGAGGGQSFGGAVGSVAPSFSAPKLPMESTTGFSGQSDRPSIDFPESVSRDIDMSEVETESMASDPRKRARFSGLLGGGMGVESEPFEFEEAADSSFDKRTMSDEELGRRWNERQRGEIRVDGIRQTDEKLESLSGERVNRTLEMAQLESRLKRAREIRDQKEEGFWSATESSRARVAELEAAEQDGDSDGHEVDTNNPASIMQRVNGKVEVASDENMELRISELKIQLKGLNKRLGDGHRDVQVLRSTIREWEKFSEAQNRFKENKPAEISEAAKQQALKDGSDFGLELVTRTRMETKTRMVPTTRMTTETKTRSVPVQRTRTEQRTRMVNGKEETYQVSVPYTENVTQNYTVQVPVTEMTQQSYQISVPYYSLGLPGDNADKLITDLASSLDPGGKTEFKLEELIRRSAQSWQESDDPKKAKKAPPAVISSPAGASAKAPAKGNEESASKAQGKPSLSAAQSQRLVVLLSDKLAGKKLSLDVSDVLRTLDRSLAKRNSEIRKARTWKRVKAVPNATRLMVGDKDELDLTGMQVNVQVDGFRARVLIDCFYYNDRATQLEGNFKLRLPDDASLYYFAFGESAYDFQPKGELAKSEFLDDGTQFVSLGAPEIREARKDAWANVKEARMVPREKAAHAYRETVRRKVDPALVEWAGAGVFNARVFPLAPQKLHRIVIGYDVNLTKTDDGWTYQLDLPQEPGQCQVDLNIQPVAGVEYGVTPKSAPLENVINGKSHQRYRFLGKQENGIELTANKTPQILLRSSDDNEGDFWGIQIKPDLPVEKVDGSPVGIFMVDTSLSSNPDKFNVWLEMLRSTLDNNRDSLKHFNVLFFNVDGHFWKDGYVANTPENVEQLMETCDTLALEGATDLYGAIEQITSADWAFRSAESSDSSEASQSKQRPDLFLLSDGAATWGETNLRLIGRQIADNNLGSLFAYQTGLTGTSISSLRFLAGQSGGAVFSVATEDEIKTASTAHRKRPWKLKSVAAAGATDTMTAGRVQWVYPGQSITIVGRGELDGPIELELDQASNEKTISIPLDQIEQVESELASRLYGQVAVGQLESLGAKVFDVAASYARHFRVTGETCSLLMLESEADYERFDIKPKEDLFVIKSKVAKDLIANTLKKSADQLADPKAQTLAWLERLESMPGMSFKMPTALKLAMDEIEIVAISKPLECSLTRKDSLSQPYLAALSSERLDYEKIAGEANRRGGTSVDEAIKVFSSLVERSPGDIVIARDVAFTAMELDRPAQAYHLLRRVALARPFQGSIYPALGQCLTQLGQADMAIVYYEVALGGKFHRQGENFQQIVSTEYMHLLRQITSGKLDSSVPDFAAARLETMEKNAKFNSADVVITMMWNTDQTDVDLHVVEPSGEECSYENKRTRTNGQITSDITTGFGPEMYFNAEAPKGKYEIKVKYFRNAQNRTELRNKVHLMIYRDFGTENEKLDRRTVELKTVGKKESVATIGIE